MLIAAAMRDTRPDVTQQPFGFNVAGFFVVSPPVNSCRSHAIPRIERIRVMLSHLLFCSETITEFIEHKVGVDGRYASYQDHQHPFHRFRLDSCPTGNEEA
ncbi:hypothetical protein JJB99_26565 [Bradyrhizobium diazoefficiens]|uniref:hypothetical protein n=1 Tax=Bradyrhizobium diazoefficiens TaxID=1355477 RepID=UPI00190C6528|nr:hypothetical protein [Bradyrhizobium diazoefficiens]QQO12974.1 hypothetical protein JJB99_26565 [Bradyrhizobium diazoefficiens]